MSNYVDRLVALNERAEMLKQLVEMHRANLVEGDDVDCTTDLVNGLYEYYSHLCTVDDACDGACNHSLALLAGVAIHALAGADFDRDRPANTRPHDPSLN